MLRQSRDLTIILKNIIGKYAKSDVNINGEKLFIKGKDGLTANQQIKVKLLQNILKRLFAKNKQTIRAIPPTQMAMSFIEDKIRKVITKMQASKSPGCDEIPVENRLPEPYTKKT